eukprot:evm.model.scf_2409.2 EVM.evm.TU.scf_2409.2   scf_2409:10073-10519(+)
MRHRCHGEGKWDRRSGRSKIGSSIGWAADQRPILVFAQFLPMVFYFAIYCRFSPSASVRRGQAHVLACAHSETRRSGGSCTAASRNELGLVLLQALEFMDGKKKKKKNNNMQAAIGRVNTRTATHPRMHSVSPASQVPKCHDAQDAGH